jgi:hypothetical protein
LLVEVRSRQARGIARQNKVPLNTVLASTAGAAKLVTGRDAVCWCLDAGRCAIMANAVWRPIRNCVSLPTYASDRERKIDRFVPKAAHENA